MNVRCIDKKKYMTTMAARVDMFDSLGSTHPDGYDAVLCPHCLFTHIKKDDEEIIE